MPITFDEWNAYIWANGLTAAEREARRDEMAASFFGK